ncbi:MAG: BrnT family toxin [Schwartzia sp.]|nr:BrnT family toxin [Schwartzia sp. (in: firmicutes)]
MLRFEWDRKKDVINQRKHGVAFTTAKNVFYDESRIDIPDETHSISEDRRITIGKADKVLFVVYTERKYDIGNTIRLISARRANEEERRFYYEQPGFSY